MAGIGREGDLFFFLANAECLDKFFLKLFSEKKLKIIYIKQNFILTVLEGAVYIQIIRSSKSLCAIIKALDTSRSFRIL